MLRNLFCKSQFSVGIDLDGINIVVLCKKHNEIKILVAASEKCNSCEEKIKFLQNFFVQNKIGRKNIYMAIAATHTIKKKLQFASILQETDIKLQLEVEQKKYFPGIGEKLAFEAARMNNQATIVYAAKQKLLSDKLNLLQKAKIYPVCIEPDSFAWLRLIDHAQRKNLIEDKAGVLLVIQYNKTRIIIFNHNEILYENEEFSRDDISALVRRNLDNFRASNFKYKLSEFYFIGSKGVITTSQQEQNWHDASPAGVDNNLLLAYGLALRGFDD